MKCTHPHEVSCRLPVHIHSTLQMWEWVISSGSDPLGWRGRCRSDRRCRTRRRPIVNSSRNIINNPVNTLYDVVSSHSAARHNRPLVRLDSVQIESLRWGHRRCSSRKASIIELTVRISALVSAPLISCLFANTSKDAPASLCQ